MSTTTIWRHSRKKTKCIDCNRNAKPGRVRCARHLDDNHLARKELHKRRRAAGKCYKCGRKPLHPNSVSQCVRCMERCLVYTKEKQRGLRSFCLEKYGNRCSCPKCPERHNTHPQFLTFDHVHGQGTRHYKEVGHNIMFYKWIIKNNFPDTLRLLCWNCNCGRAKNGGVCPHEDELAEMLDK
jgi:hypothetical protein